MAGEKVDLTPVEKARFRLLAEYYGEYRRILENVDASRFESLENLGHAIRFGRLSRDSAEAETFVNKAYDANADAFVSRMFETTLGAHLSNRTAFDKLSPDRKERLLKAALAEEARRGVTGYEAGAFIIGSFIDMDAPPAFWRSFDPESLARALNEWVLHQKYLQVLEDVGEKKLSRARESLLGNRLGTLKVSKGLALGFARLKLSGADLAAARARLDAGADPQTRELLDLLAKPWGELIEKDDADPGRAWPRSAPPKASRSRRDSGTEGRGKWPTRSSRSRFRGTSRTSAIPREVPSGPMSPKRSRRFPPARSRSRSSSEARGSAPAGRESAGCPTTIAAPWEPTRKPGRPRWAGPSRRPSAPGSSGAASPGRSARPCSSRRPRS